MGWILLIIIGYAPLFYHIHKRLRELENKVEKLKGIIKDKIE